MQRSRLSFILCLAAMVVASAGPTFGQCVVPAAGEVARYQGDGDATDSVGTNDATLVNGAGFGTGLLGQAFVVDGVDDYVEAPDVPVLDFTNTLTLAAWVFPDNPANGDLQTFVSKPNASGGTGYRLGLSPDGSLNLGANDGFGTNCVLTSPSPLLASQWSHVAGSLDSDGTVTLWVNGQVVAAAPLLCELFTLENSAESLQIGREFAILGGRHFDGAIDQVRLFNRALSNGEIQGLFDPDCDGVGDHLDNCQVEPNPDQADADNDGIGDACDVVADSDGDGIGDDEDNCPSTPNPDQEDFDGDGLGDACDDDIDGDGTANAHDHCDFTPAGEVVGHFTGCSIAQLCPCDGPFGSTASWRNHGQYVACVAITATIFRLEHLITNQQKAQIIRDAAHSDCGR